MERISQSQLVAMIILFQIGSSPLFLLASQSSQDAWISILIGLLCGLLLLLLVTLPIQRLELSRNLIEILQVYFGKFVGGILGGGYIIYFCYKAIRNVREFGDLIGVYLLPTTPLLVIIILFLVVASYAVYQGIEVFARITQILLPLTFLLYSFIFLLLYGTGLLDFHRLQPVLENGFREVLDAAIPEVISFPFGEMVLFLMFWKYVSPSKNMTKVTLGSYLLAGLCITITNILIIVSLGPLSELSVVPLMQAISLVELANFIERLDPIVALLLFTGVFIKMTAYFLGAVLGLSQLLRIKHWKALLLIGLILLLGAMSFKSYMQQVWIGFEVNLKFHFPIFQIIIPAMLLLMMLLRSRSRRRTP